MLQNALDKNIYIFREDIYIYNNLEQQNLQRYGVPQPEHTKPLE